MWPVNKKIGVMVVDDSILARTMISQGLAASPRIEVVGTCFNARDALNKVEQYPFSRFLDSCRPFSISPLRLPLPS